MLAQVLVEGDALLLYTFPVAFAHSCSFLFRHLAVQLNTIKPTTASRSRRKHVSVVCCRLASGAPTVTLSSAEFIEKAEVTVK